jgi:hypothetical protein
LGHEGTHSGAAEIVLVRGLRAVLTVTYVPLVGNVALLDTTSAVWILELDTGSSAQDHCWAMIDVLRILSFGAPAAQSATASPRLRLVGSSTR